MTARRRHPFRGLALLAALGAALAAPAARGEIYATADTKVLVFGDGADGDTAPYHVIEGEATGIEELSSLAVDLVHRELFVADGNGKVLVFDLDDDGDVEPKRTIAGASTGLIGAAGMAVDPDAGELWVADPDADRVFVFARDADGDVAPLRAIGGATSTLNTPIHLLLDRLHGEVLVSTLGFDPGPGDDVPTITVFDLDDVDSPGLNDVAPARRLVGAPTQLISPRGLAMDVAEDFIVVADYANSLRFYARTAQDDDAPVNTITGPTTELQQPYDLVLRSDNELLSGNDGSPASKLVGHDLGGTADATPVRVLEGASTLLEFSTGAATDRAKYCSEGHVVTGCLFRDNFESGGICYWSDRLGGPSCF